MRIFQGAHYARRHLGPGLAEPRVDRRQHDVELAEHLVGEVHRAVCQDIALGAGENADPEPRLQLSDCHRPVPPETPLKPGSFSTTSATAPGSWSVVVSVQGMEV